MLRRFSSAPLLRRRFLSPPLRKAITDVVRKLNVSSSFPPHSAYPAADQSHSLLPSSPYGFVKLLSETAANSSSLSAAERSHSTIVKVGLTSNVFVTTALLRLYFEGGSFNSALQLFDEMPHRNVVTWNTLIHGISQLEQSSLAIEVFSEMLVAGVLPTPFSISSVAAAASRLRDLVAGVLIHCFGLKMGFLSNVFVGTSLVDMYSKCSDMTAAMRVFVEMHEHNVVTWTSLVTGYAQHQRPVEAMLLVREMRELGVDMNKVTYNGLLSSFRRSEDLVHGKQVHCVVIKDVLDSDPYTVVSLITMYSKCGSSEDFMKACSNVLEWNQVSFNSIIAGFSFLGDGREAFVKLLEMRRACIDIDIFTFASVLRAIGIVSALQEGRQTHALILKCGHACSVSVQNGLVSMYAKCGEIEDSKLVFLWMDDLDLISWNSLISGCAQHGYGKEAIELFEEMRVSGIKPDSTTYLSVLSACGHVGIIEKGIEYLHLMKKEDPPIIAGMEHYACVVDLLARAGYLHEANLFANNMPIKPDVSVYRALLSGCQVHGNVEIAKHAAQCLFDLSPNDSGIHVLLSNVFAADECWHSAARIRKLMVGKRVRKIPAWSWIEDLTCLKIQSSQLHKD